MKKYFYLGLMSIGAFVITLCFLSALVSTVFYIEDVSGLIDPDMLRRMALRGHDLQYIYKSGLTSAIIMAITFPFYIWSGKQYEKHDNK